MGNFFTCLNCACDLSDLRLQLDSLQECAGVGTKPRREDSNPIRTANPCENTYAFASHPVSVPGGLESLHNVRLILRHEAKLHCSLEYLKPTQCSQQAPLAKSIIIDESGTMSANNPLS